MRLFVATHETQGQRASDFAWVPDGELVNPFDFECDSDKNRIDGGCGCRRSFTGLESRKGTTTALVIESDMTEEAFEKAIYYMLRKAFGQETAQRESYRMARDAMMFAMRYQPGTIVERRGTRLVSRGMSQEVR